MSCGATCIYSPNYWPCFGLDRFLLVDTFAFMFISFIDNQNTWERSSDNLGNFTGGVALRVVFLFTFSSLRVYFLLMDGILFMDGIDWTCSTKSSRRRERFIEYVLCQMEIVKNRNDMNYWAYSILKFIHRSNYYASVL
jgi:hypothetical protein